MMNRKLRREAARMERRGQFRPAPQHRLAPLQKAKVRAIKYTRQELEAHMSTFIRCCKRMSEGVATQTEIDILITMCLISLAVDNQGIVRGLREHFEAAHNALDAISTRAKASGKWMPCVPYFHELDAIKLALDLHRFQAEQLSHGELNAATRRMINQHRARGIAVEHITGLSA